MDDEPKPKRPSYTAALGLIIAVIVGVIGWLIAPQALQWLADHIANFPATSLPLAISRPLFTVIVILVALIIFGLVAALLAPKDAQKASEIALERERESLRRRQKAERDQVRRGKDRKY